MKVVQRLGLVQTDASDRCVRSTAFERLHLRGSLLTFITFACRPRQTVKILRAQQVRIPN